MRESDAQWAGLIGTRTASDSHSRAVVSSVNSDGSYQVVLDNTSTQVRCEPWCAASSGDRVLVTIMADGKCAAVGKLQGVSYGGFGSSSILGRAILGKMVLGSEGGGSSDGDEPPDSAGGGNLPTVTEADNGKVLMVVGGEWAAAKLPVYAGSYSVTPTADGLSVSTAGSYMEKNMTVNPIPYSETSNNSGGSTIYIASEVEK